MSELRNELVELWSRHQVTVEECHEIMRELEETHLTKANEDYKKSVKILRLCVTQLRFPRCHRGTTLGDNSPSFKDLEAFLESHYSKTIHLWRCVSRQPMLEQFSELLLEALHTATMLKQNKQLPLSDRRRQPTLLQVNRDQCERWLGSLKREVHSYHMRMNILEMPVVSAQKKPIRMPAALHRLFKTPTAQVRAHQAQAIERQQRNFETAARNLQSLTDLILCNLTGSAPCNWGRAVRPTQNSNDVRGISPQTTTEVEKRIPPQTQPEPKQTQKTVFKARASGHVQPMPAIEEVNDRPPPQLRRVRPMTIRE